MKFMPQACRKLSFGLLAIALLAACSESSSRADAAPQAKFWEAMQSLCGLDLPGQVYEIPAAEDEFSGVLLSVSRCSRSKIEADLFVNGRVREIWTLSRTRNSLVLEHRDYALGEDKVLIYGGTTETQGTAAAQMFPANEATRSLLEAFQTNVWTLRFQKGHHLVYRLDRAEKSPFFELRFDLPDGWRTPSPVGLPRDAERAPAACHRVSRSRDGRGVRRHKLMPRDPGGDALHLALASHYRCDFLATWNCRHLANANKFDHIRRINGILGLFVPALVTPLELLGEEDG